MAATNTLQGSVPDLLDAVYAAGEAVLAALVAADFESAVAHAQERGALIALLAATGRPGPDTEPHRQRLWAQDAVLTERLGEAQAQLADALRVSGRYQHAAGQYAGGAPVHARLQARG